MDKFYLQRREFNIEYNKETKQYSIKYPTEGKAYRNNKLIDMSLAVLTHKTTVDKILNPGNFEPQKHMGYKIAAAKLGYSWSYLSALSTDELKDLCYKESNLCTVDTQIQFYKQNSTAGTILGMFAVQKVAHAILESEGYSILLNDIIDNPFTVFGKEFTISDYVEFDTQTNNKGELIGKILGSLVASAADAVKDPVLNLMNINSITTNVFCTMIRMGYTFEQASLFLSQKIITDALNEYSSRNLTEYITFNDVIKEFLDKINKEKIPGIKESPEIIKDIDEQDCINGLTESNDLHDYKVLIAYQNFQNISNAIKPLNYVTRFNSISNAVGPLIIDNLIMEHKLSEFDGIYQLEKNENGVTGIKSISLYDIRQQHPMLDKFIESLDVANDLLKDMPTRKITFINLLNSMSENLQKTMFSHRDLFDDLCNFYLSYCLVASNMIENISNGKNMKYYIQDFVKDFSQNKYKEIYNQNPFIQAIKLNTEKIDNVEKTVLKIDIVGLDMTDKENLSNGWIDLYKENSKLAIDLFLYNFYRGGLGFTPKTFMNLLPVYIKERLNGYVDSFKHTPELNTNYVLDQFIRNNWSEEKLVPTIQSKDITVQEDGIIKSSKYYSYIKVGSKFIGYKLYKHLNSDDNIHIYEEISPLGNNGEYLEISKNDIKVPLSQTTQISNNNENGFVTPNSELDESQQEEMEKTDKLLRSVLTDVQYGNIMNKNMLSSRLKNMNSTKQFLKVQFEKKNVSFSDELFEKICKLMCN